MSGVPLPRAAADDHLCADCTGCTGCAGGDALPTAFEVILRPDGELRARCTDCGGTGWLCPAAPAAAR